MAMHIDTIVVIGWQPSSRRSESFARHVGAKLFLIHYLKFKYPPLAPLKYLLQSAVTFKVLIRERPRILVVENPPPFLALAAYCFKAVSGGRMSLVIDSATGVFYEPKWRWFQWLFRSLARAASMNIVTNEPLAGILRRWGACAFVLEDRIPDLPAVKTLELSKAFTVAVVNTFSFDEPVEEICAAADRLPEARFYVTGNVARAKKEVLRRAPRNVTFTGFLPEGDYFSLLGSADCVMVLCTVDHTLCCGMYEALALGTPLVVSDWGVVRAYFNRGTVYVENTPAAIIEGVRRMMAEGGRLRGQMRTLKEERLAAWKEKCESLMRLLEGPDEQKS